MEIKKIVVGALEANCYVLTENDTCLIIDPGADYMKIKDAIGDNKVLGVLITHSHFDHIGALRNFLTKRSIRIFKRSGIEEKRYSIGDFEFDVIYTPGHSKDSVAFFFENEKALFSGDTIFKESVGRTDLPGGNPKELTDSLERIKDMDPSINIYPGHGEDTTLDYELKNNEYLK